jgi:hypothetical protein
MSGISKPDFIMKVRSTPQPKAKPEYLEGSMPPFLKTVGCTIPAPPSSSQPDLQTLQPAPLQMPQVMSTSNDGSVNWK